MNKPIKQSDGALLNPFEQAKRYILELPVSQHPRWVVTCNFSTFYVYDMERPRGEPEIIELANLEKEYYRLQFLVDAGNEHLKREMEVSIAAGEIVGLLYDAFYKQYANPESEHSLKSLNKLCVRLVFCLYAEDAGIFGHHGMFHDYLKGFDTRGLRKGLVDLFRVLDTKLQDRDPYLKDDNPELAAFPYVNGGLFSDENIEIPPFTDEIRNLLLEKASENFNWSEISPTIFGAVFESTLNPETRRSGGMHYTGIENIHKVIDPLFLDDLKAELEDIKARVAASKVTSLFDNAETVGDVKIASAYFTGTSGDTLRGMCDTIRDNAKAAAVAVLVGKSDDKITMAVTVTKDAQAKGLKAGNLVKEISAIAGGKGGGKPDFAMAGLKDETKIDEALAAVKSIVEKQLG